MGAWPGCRNEAQAPTAAAQLLDHEAAFPVHDDDVQVLGVQRLVDDERVACLDAEISHRITFRRRKEGRHGVADHALLMSSTSPM